MRPSTRTERRLQQVALQELVANHGRPLELRVWVPATARGFYVGARVELADLPGRRFIVVDVTGRVTGLSPRGSGDVLRRTMALVS